MVWSVRSTLLTISSVCLVRSEIAEKALKCEINSMAIFAKFRQRAWLPSPNPETSTTILTIFSILRFQGCSQYWPLITGLTPFFSGLTNRVPNSRGTWKASKRTSYPASGLSSEQDTKDDGFVKSPSAALHCILRRCGVQPKYASLLWICAPCIWSFLLCHPL